MQLVGVEHRCRAALEVAHGSSFLGHDQRALELSCIAGVDAEIGRQLHGTLHTLGDEHEGAIAEDR